MANIIQLKDSANAVFYPQTHEKAVIDANGVNLETKLANITTPSYVVAWDGASTPVVANIPAGVTVTYNTTDYTGTLAASASTVNKTYLVSTGTTDNYNRYVTQLNGSTYSWQNLGSTEIDLSDYATKAELNQLDQEVKEGISVQTFEYSQFGNHESASAAISLTDDLRMTAADDYIELKAMAKSNVYVLRRPTTSNQPCVRWSSQDTLQIRFNSSTNWTYQNNAVDWSKAQVLKIVLDSVVDTTYNYKIYLDGAQVGTQAVTNSTGWNQIVYGATIDCRLYYIEAKIAGVVTRFDKFAEMTGAVSVTDVYSSEEYDGLIELNARVGALEPKVAALEHAVTGEDMYFLFKKVSTLYNITSHFYIYQRLKGNYYLGTCIGYYIYDGAASYPNGYWRVERTNIVTITDGEISAVEMQVITAGENEFVLQWLDGSGYNFSGGFSGGFHYGETIENVVGAWVRFVADGHDLSTDADIPLTPCKSFYYQEYSPIYQHNDDTIAAWHLKHTVFKDGGWETVNDVKFVQALDYFAYPGIVCVSRWLSEYAMPENVATITDMGDGSTTIAEQFKSSGHRIHFEGNGYITDVESEVLIGANDSLCECVVYNSSAYNKYYRRNPDTVGSTSNRLKGRTKVKIAAMNP